MFNVKSAERRRCGLGAVLFVLVAASPGAFAQDTGGWSGELADAFKNGEFEVGFRYRYEFVDSANLDKNANASTLRTRLVFKSAEYKDVFLTLNMDDVRPLIADDFNDTRNGKTEYPVVIDPKGTDLNLASLTWVGVDGGALVLGRQRIKRANVRFVGNVAWRQNEQTFDALSFAYEASEKFDIFYSYVDRVKRVFGPNENTTGVSATAASWSSESHLLDASYTFGQQAKLFVYWYSLDFANAAAFSSQTIGLRATGDHRFGDGPILVYQAELAEQSDHKDNPNDYDANYYLLDGALNWERLGVRLGYEVLEGNGVPGSSFQTPLATLHKFNGWADRFVLNPGDGVEDLYLEGSARLLEGDWRLIYHQFTANNTSENYGNELDFLASWKLARNYALLLKAALYKADQSSCNPQRPLTCDVDKFWVMFNADF